MWLRETDSGIARGGSDQATTLRLNGRSDGHSPQHKRDLNGNARNRPGGLRVLIHDFAGHPFQIDLSRALARRGHTVQHVYCGSYTSGKGRLQAGNTDNLSVVPIAVSYTHLTLPTTERV